MATLPLLPTTLVGSYPQPDWLVDKDALLGAGPPRVRMDKFWRVPRPLLDGAQDDAVLLALRDMERAGLDIVTDGEIRRESYFNHFANSLDGIDLDQPGEVPGRTGKPTLVPRVVGPVRRARPVELEAARFLRASTDRAIKITVPGPFTMTMLAKNEHYADERALAMAYADAVNAELKDLKNAGVDVVQIDEPYLSPNADRARGFALEAIDRALHGVAGPTALHMCMGYAYVVKEKATRYAFLPELAASSVAQVSIEAAEPRLDLSVLKDLPGKSVMVGVLNLGDLAVETAGTVASRIDEALRHLPPERLIVAPDCGLKYLPRAVAYGKMAAMVEGARRVRARL
ncbi:MAG: 5-methyltetrahydropteroyltriglutamate--homocysteine methyltransferase [Rhodospirillales bacterium]|nr:MAG: 5-methyltetrahydropteroyltriglutamate--homocysteine methyltransferase [Rhodospirillales bacterium]